jgi:chromate reductase
MRILALSGSLRRDSLNTRLLRAAQELGGPGVEFLSYESLAAIPPFTQDLEHRQPAEVHELRQRIESADAVLIATPEYNGSIPGALKNALDWVSRPFATNVLRQKPVAVVGASKGVFGAAWAQADLRKVLSRIGAFVDERELLVGSAHEQFTGDLRLRDPALAARLTAIVESLADCNVRRAA